MFICAGLGFGWSRLGRVYDTEQTTALVTTIGAPCLAFHTLANLSAGAALLGSMAAIAATAIVSCALLGAVVLRLARLPTRTFLPSLMFANTGNMGLPLAFLAFGDEGLHLAIGVFVVHTIAMFTVGVALASGRLSLTDLARIPLLYAVAAALAFMVSGIRPPTWLNATTDLLGGITIPLMLFTLGTSLARLRVANLKLSAALAVLRLVLGFSVAVGLVTVLSVEGPARGVLVLQLSMPVAVFNYLFAQRYGQQPSDVAAVVVLSTALSFVTLPVLLWYVL